MKTLAIRLFVFAIFVLGLSLPGAGGNGLPLADPVQGTTLSYQVRGYGINFAPDKVSVNGPADGLLIDFVNGNKISPKPASEAAEGQFTGVAYDNLWNGIGLEFSAQDGAIYSTKYVVYAGADPSDIRLRYSAPVSVNSDGVLNISVKYGFLTESAPVAWQNIEGRQTTVAVSFLMQGREVGFKVGQYDPRYDLFIDPSLIWNTFLGGSGFDFGYSIQIDETGNSYVAGSSNAAWGCSLSPCTVRAFSDGYDVFVSKVDPSGHLVWNTFLGGPGNEDDFLGVDLVRDADGNLYVTGFTGTDWGCESTNCTIRAYNGGQDVFVAKLDSSGNLLWNTFLGGSTGDVFGGLAVDKDGSLYVTGASGAGWGCPSVSCTLTAFHGNMDVFVAKLGADGSLIWNTFIGEAGGYNDANGIVLDDSNGIYVTGKSFATWGVPVRPFSSPYDGYVFKLDKSGALVWNTFIGGNSGDDILDIKLDKDGFAYVCGNSTSTWGDPIRPLIPNASDMFVAKVDVTGSLVWNTFLGGYNHDYGANLVVEEDKYIYLAGNSGDSWGRPVLPFSGGSPDAVVVKLSSKGDLLWNAFLGSDALNGSSGWDGGNDIDIDSDGNQYVTGYSTRSWGDPVEPIGSGFYKAFVAKIKIPLVVASIEGMSPNPTNANSILYRVLFSDSVTGLDESDFVITTTGSIQNAAISDISGSGNEYLITMNTGSGTGTLRLDIVDDDSIVDTLSNPLGGPGPGNGDFQGDETYTIDKTPPTVISSVGVNVIYTGETVKEFRVTFSEPVNGVDKSDFSLTVNDIQGAYISGMSGSGTTYIVNVKHQRGPGTIRLDVIDDDTIIDQVNQSLGGMGISNGNFTKGEAVWNSPLVNLLSDPGFESIPSPYWNGSSTNFDTPVCVVGHCSSEGGSIGPHAGDAWGRFGGTAKYEYAWLSQSVFIPKGYTGLKLQFYLWVTGTGTATNTFEITMDGVKLFSTNATQKKSYPLYTPITVDVSQFANDAVHQLKITSLSYGQITNFNLDDMTLTDFTFNDVPSTHWAWPYIEHLAHANVTGGCSTTPLQFCPEASVNRAQMAVFILRGIHGSSYTPPAAKGDKFKDIPANYWAAAWIEQLANEGITGGCGDGNYCPNLAVTRDQMAIFLLRGKYGAGYIPPNASGTMFKDVPSSHWAAKWIEQLASEQVTGGCGNNNYCPGSVVTRAQMAVFLVKVFSLP